MPEKNRTAIGALFALAVAAIGAGAMKADPRGLGKDPMLRGPLKAIGVGGAIWLAWDALKRRIGPRA